MAIVFVALPSLAQAADLRKACEAARRADKHYNDGNAGEAAVRMTAWEMATQEEIEHGASVDVEKVKSVTTDIMAFGAQILDAAEGKRTLKAFIADACD